MFPGFFLDVIQSLLFAPFLSIWAVAGEGIPYIAKIRCGSSQTIEN
jgi:hypothetical protein